MGKNINSRNPKTSGFAGLYLYLANEVTEWKVLAKDLLQGIISSRIQNGANNTFIDTELLLNLLVARANTLDGEIIQFQDASGAIKVVITTDSIAVNTGSDGRFVVKSNSNGGNNIIGKFLDSNGASVVNITDTKLLANKLDAISGDVINSISKFVTTDYVKAHAFRLGDGSGIYNLPPPGGTRSGIRCYLQYNRMSWGGTGTGAMQLKVWSDVSGYEYNAVGVNHPLFDDLSLKSILRVGIGRDGILSSAAVGIGEESHADIPKSYCDVKSPVAEGYRQFALRTQYTPNSSSDINGQLGDICYDDNYMYYRNSTGWVRSQLLSTF